MYKSFTLSLYVYLIFSLFICEFAHSQNVSIKEELAFTVNKGQLIDANSQVRPELLYYTDAPGQEFFIRNNGFSQLMFSAFKKDELPQGHRLDFIFLGSNLNASLESSEAMHGNTNYYLPHCLNGIHNVPSYKGISTLDIYPGIDIFYKGERSRGLKYDLVVNPGASLSSIQLKVKGANKIELTHKGDILIKTSIGEILKKVPYCYQIIDNEQIVVDIQYHVSGDGVISFKSNQKYDQSYSLIIDPWVTYYGGNSNDYGEGITVDGTGNAIVVGTTSSFNFPVSPGAYQVVSVGANEAIVVKFDNAGNRLWATYFGGDDNDIGTSVAIDNNDDIWILGKTESFVFPVTPTAYQSSNGGGEDGFIAKFSNSGALMYASFFGGIDTEENECITVDANNNVVFTGTTESVNFPVSAGAFQTVYPGIASAYIAKFNSNGVYQWATFLGGNALTGGTGISTDASNNIVAVGSTMATNFPITGGVFQPALAGSRDIYVSKFDPSGAILWSTYYGGTGLDLAMAVDVTPSGGVAVTGHVPSGFPITAGAYQVVYGGGLLDAFLFMLDASGNQLWSTYIGASDKEEGYGVTSDGNFLYIAGDTYSADLIITTCPYQLTNGGDEEQFVGVFDFNGQNICMSYLGGSGHDEMHANIGVFNGEVFLTGYNPGSYPVTPGAFQSVFGGGVTDLMIVKISCGSGSFSFSLATICQGDSLLINGIYQSSTGTYNDTIIGGSVSGCDSVISTTLTVNSLAYGFINEEICQGDSILISSIWENMAGFYTDTINNGAFNGCDSITEINLSVLPVFDATILSDSVYCEEDLAIDLQAVSPGGIWSGTGITNTVNGTFEPSNAAPGNHVVTYIIDGMCGDTGVVNILVNETPNIAYTYQNDSCALSLGYVDLDISGGSMPYSYAWSDGSVNEGLSGLITGSYTVEVTDLEGCSKMQTFIIEDYLQNCSGQLWLPNIFSPNLNGLNDVLYVHGAETATSFLFTIYDRWGEKVFETTDPNIGWDGTYNGKPMNMGVFAYVATAIYLDESEALISGTITLVR